MKYLSTRDNSLNQSFNDILYQGLSKDGGLYLPREWPTINLDKLLNLSYQEVATEIIHSFTKDDISKEDLSKIIMNSYVDFKNDKIAPILKLDNNKFLLELFYGPTYAFKDFALQLLGNIYDYILRKRKIKLTDTLIGIPKIASPPNQW